MNAIQSMSTKFMNLFRVMAISAMVFAVFAIPQPVRACSCVMPGASHEELSKGDAVFSGKVLNITNAAWTPLLPVLNRLVQLLDLDPVSHYRYEQAFNYRRVAFAVQNSWKGVTSVVAHVQTGHGGGDCGYEFIIGSDYLVYARGPVGKLETSICSRTTEASNAGTDMAYLNTLPAITLTTPTSPLTGILILLFFVFLFALTGTIFFRLRRRRQPSEKSDAQESRLP